MTDQHDCQCLGVLAAEVLELIESQGELRIRLDALFRQVQALKEERDVVTGGVAGHPGRVITVSPGFWSDVCDD